MVYDSQTSRLGNRHTLKTSQHSPLTPRLTGMVLRTPTPTPTQNHSNHGDGGDGGGTLLHDETLLHDGTLLHQRGLSRAASQVVMNQGKQVCSVL